MPRFLIEVTHAGGPHDCEEVINALMHTGSHFMVNADWGCRDDVHTAWLTVEADNKDEISLIIPPHFRNEVRIIELTRYSPNEMNDQPQIGSH